MSDVDQIRQRFLSAERRQLETVQQGMDVNGKEGAAYAQEHAPWKDITGQARQGLVWVPLHPADPLQGARGAWAGLAPHNKWLETTNGSRFEILQTTAALYGQRLLDRLRGKG